MNKLLKSVCLCGVCVFSFAVNLHSQNYSPLDAEDVLEQMAMDDEEEPLSMENMMESLAYLRENPLNINTATRAITPIL